MEQTRIRARVMVSGLVQGVWFRASTAEMASKVGVFGWVRNLPDGRVEAVYEGEPTAVRTALEWTRSGPLHARVDSVEIFEEPPQGEVRFTVR